jgi:DNA replication protein DnaC
MWLPRPILTNRSSDGILRSDLVLLDELGFAPLDPSGGQLLFRFVAAAYERRSLGIASHRPLNDWGRFLPNQTTAVSRIDRLLPHAVVVVTTGAPRDGFTPPCLWPARGVVPRSRAAA